MSRLAVLPDGCRLVYDDHGTGPAVLLVHGWGTSRLVWQGQTRELAAGHRVVAVDWRGCGDSDHPATGNCVRQVAEDLVRLVELLDLAPVIAVGSSLGGNAVLDLAVHHPQLLRAAVLVDAPQHHFADGLPEGAFDAWLATLSERRPEVLDRMVAGWFGPGGGAALRAWTLQLLLRSGWWIDDTLRSAQQHDLRSLLPSCTVPVALVHGAHDGEVPISVSRQTAELLPHGGLHVLPDAGHMPALDDPVAFNRLLLGLIQQWGASTPIPGGPA